MLEAANGDPLRAAEIEKNIDVLWWKRWLLMRHAKSEKEDRNAK
jgi:hypothetical protein